MIEGGPTIYQDGVLLNNNGELVGGKGTPDSRYDKFETIKKRVMAHGNRNLSNSDAFQDRRAHYFLWRDAKRLAELVESGLRGFEYVKQANLDAANRRNLELEAANAKLEATVASLEKSLKDEHQARLDARSDADGYKSENKWLGQNSDTYRSTAKKAEARIAELEAEIKKYGEFIVPIRAEVELYHNGKRVTLEELNK